MSKPVCKDLFSFQGRRNRKSYAIFFLLFVVVSTVLAVSINNLAATPTTGLLEMLLILANLVLLVMLLAVASQRCRDFNWRGWLVLLLFLPGIGAIFGFLLMLIPGSSGENRFGPDPVGRHPAPQPDELIRRG